MQPKNNPLAQANQSNLAQVPPPSPLNYHAMGYGQGKGLDRKNYVILHGYKEPLGEQGDLGWPEAMAQSNAKYTNGVSDYTAPNNQRLMNIVDDVYKKESGGSPRPTAGYTADAMSKNMDLWNNPNSPYMKNYPGDGISNEYWNNWSNKNMPNMLSRKVYEDSFMGMNQMSPEEKTAYIKYKNSVGEPIPKQKVGGNPVPLNTLSKRSPGTINGELV